MIKMTLKIGKALFVWFCLLVSANTLNAQFSEYNQVYDVLFEDSTYVRETPSVSGKIMGTLRHQQTVDRCYALFPEIDEVNGQVGYWLPVRQNGAIGYLWDKTLAVAQFKSLLDLDNHFLVGSSYKEVNFKIFRKGQLEASFAFALHSDSQLMSTGSLGKTFNSHGREVLAVQLENNDYLLFEWDGRKLVQSNLELADDSFFTKEYEMYPNCIISSDQVQLREEPNLSSKSLASLSKHTQVELLMEEYSTDKIHGKEGYWHQVKWKGQTGYVWYEYLSIPNKFIKSNKEEGLSFLYTSNAVYVLKNDVVLDQVDAIANYHAYYFFDAGSFGLSEDYHFLSIYILAESCGAAGGDELYLWDGKKLNYFGFDYGVGDGGLSDVHSLTFPSEKGGVKDLIIKRDYDGESLIAPKINACDENYQFFIYNDQTYFLKYTGDTLIEVPSPHGKVRRLIKSEYPKHSLKHVSFIDVNMDGMDDALFYIEKQSNNWENPPTDQIVGIAYGTKNGQFKVQYENSKLIDEAFTAVQFDSTDGQLHIQIMYNSGYYGFSEYESAYSVDYVFKYIPSNDKIYWDNYTVFNGTEQEIDSWNSTSKFFKSNSFEFNKVWSVIKND